MRKTTPVYRSSPRTFLLEETSQFSTKQRRDKASGGWTA
uniref:Uncharacterized protein n=1 Tax=Anguilla anguilla TaxID=7936 RepID=A0A0E9S6F5_ANGAN